MKDNKIFQDLLNLDFKVNVKTLNNATKLSFKMQSINFQA